MGYNLSMSAICIVGIGRFTLAAKRKKSSTRADAIRAKWADPAYRARMDAVMSSPAYKKKLSKAHKRNWKDPDYVEKVLSSREDALTDPAVRQRKNARKLERFRRVYPDVPLTVLAREQLWPLGVVDIHGCAILEKAA